MPSAMLLPAFLTPRRWGNCMTLPSPFYKQTAAALRLEQQLQKELENELTALVDMFRKDLERKAAVIAVTGPPCVDPTPTPDDLKQAARELLGLVPGRNQHGFPSMLEEYLKT